MFQRTDIVGIEVHGFIITRLLVFHLFAETLCLILGIVKFGKTIGNLTATDKEFEAVCNKGVIVIASRQR